jgi:hypothetical protein
MTTISNSIGHFRVLLAALAALVSGALWYSPLLFGGAWLQLRGMDVEVPATPADWQIAAQFFRDLLVAYVLAWLIARIGARTPGQACRLAALIWLGFQAMQILGSVIHEGYPIELYAIHAGDALVKSLLMAAVLTIGQGGSAR